MTTISAGAIEATSGPGKAGVNSSPPINPNTAPPERVTGFLNQSRRINTSPMTAATQYNNMAIR
jgi:hypothetical protein